MPPIEMENPRLRAVVVPELGGGLARFDRKRADGDWLPLMRPAPKGGASQPFDLASNVLVPWSNRISGGGFSFNGILHVLEPNIEGEPYPIHGNGFQSSWTVKDQGQGVVVLELVSDGPGPFLYRAELVYRLEDEALLMSLEVTNRADIALPFGMGFHPWFPRTLGTRLQAKAAEVWLEDEAHLPTDKVSISAKPEWDFASSKELPPAHANNAFWPWDGQARIEWPEHETSLRIDASDNLPVFILYSPGAEADFFCFEPVSHVVDAHNRPGGPEANGLTILTPRDVVRCGCRFALVS